MRPEGANPPDRIAEEAPRQTPVGGWLTTAISGQRTHGMFDRFADDPGLLYVVATLCCRLASFVVLLVAGGLKNLGPGASR